MKNWMALLLACLPAVLVRRGGDGEGSGDDRVSIG